ncbi:MAG: type II secretion system GspH family protein [Planctomycetes bacterium]|nr:type II secretion system GspH family protein [Planctomycetota bacterium]
MRRGSRARRGFQAGSPGFSLLEVVAALGILTLGIAAALSLFTGATAAHKRAIDRVHATAISEQAFADVESALLAGSTAEELEKDPPFGAIKRNWPGYDVSAIVCNVGGPAGKDQLLMEVHVRWKRHGQEREQVFRQVVLRDHLLE